MYTCAHISVTKRCNSHWSKWPKTFGDSKLWWLKCAWSVIQITQRNRNHVIYQEKYIQYWTWEAHNHLVHPMKQPSGLITYKQPIHEKSDDIYIYIYIFRCPYIDHITIPFIQPFDISKATNIHIRAFGIMKPRIICCSIRYRTNIDSVLWNMIKMWLENIHICVYLFKLFWHLKQKRFVKCDSWWKETLFKKCNNHLKIIQPFYWCLGDDWHFENIFPRLLEHRRRDKTSPKKESTIFLNV